MITLKYIYKNFDMFKKNLKNNNFNLLNNCIVEIYTANLNKDDAVLVAKSIKQLLPNSQIFGISACGVIYNGEQYDEDTLIIIKKYDIANSFVSTYIWENKSAKAITNEIVLSLNHSNPKMLNIVFSDHYNDIYDFIKYFNIANSNIKLFGGVAGDILSQQIIGYIFTDKGIVENGVIINAICGDIDTYCTTNIACESISPIYTVTKTSGIFWDTIENIPATEWVKEHFGIYDMTEYDDYEEAATLDPFIRLQVLLEGHNGAGRFLKFDKTENKISGYFSKTPSGTKFKIGYTAPIKCVQRCYEICNEVMQTPIDDLFSYSCLFRKMYHGNSAKWELSPFNEYNICGAFLLGEIGNINGINEHLNGSCVLSGIAESETYIIPDMTVFENLYDIEDENNEILNFVLKKQNKVISSENKRLLENLITQQEIVKEQLYIEPNTGIPNLIKYKEGIRKYGFDKLCLVHIDNMEALTVYLGRDLYYSHIKEQYQTIMEYVNSREYAEHIYAYIVDHDIFAIVSNSKVKESCFLDFTKAICDNFQFITIQNKSIPIMNRFVVSLNKIDLLENALNMLRSKDNSQKQYILCDKSSEQKLSSYHELKMLTILNRALENDGIVPYYQGIYNNKEKCITKYEALMRLVDEDGTVYSPAEFMGIAKKYHMYKLISWRMIERVFHDFNGIDKYVSINLSAHDINAKTFRDKLFEKLSNFKNSSFLILEILESEEFRDLTVLKEFISEVRNYNVKIAIDDFGSGYSNLLEMTKIAPEYIKIDGGIVKDVHNSTQNKLVLETIVYLAEKIGSIVIAENVENKNIYEHVKAANIAYSQGFYFAKPLPLEQICLNEGKY